MMIHSASWLLLTAVVTLPFEKSVWELAW